MTSNALSETLADFRTRVNGHPRIPALIRGWQPVIIVEASDTGMRRYLPVRECKVAAISEQLDDSAHTVHLRASERVLGAIFNGESNPAEAFLNGELEIFANEKDQVKLDAISLVIWGM